MAIADAASLSDLNVYLDGGNTISNNDNYVRNMASTDINGIEAIPYQFMESVDRRITGTSLGRKYSEKMYSRMPLLFLTPCIPQFMDDFNRQDKTIAANALTSLDSAVLSMLGDNGRSQRRYYSTTFQYTEYYNVLNLMLSCISVYMGLQNRYITVGGIYQQIPKINWANELSSSFKSFFSSAENLVFFVDSLDQVSESFGNDVTESSLSGLINGVSDQVNELKFLFGNTGGIGGLLSEAGATASDVLSSGLSSAASKLAGGIVGSITENSDNVMSGAKIVFPKIWNNSSYDKSYQFDIKLRSPDNDPLSIFLNIMKPYCKILALTLPRTVQSTKDVNAFSSPFLVKAAVKGMANIDMGIISSLSVTKGATCQWNDDGLPTQIDISIIIDDLYSSLHTSEYGSIFGSVNGVLDAINNTSYMDFLATNSGLNIAQMELGRKIRMASYLIGGRVENIPSNIGLTFSNTLSKLVRRMYTFTS